MKKVFFIISFLCVLSARVQAEFSGYGIKVECMPEMNILVLRNEFFPGYMANKMVGKEPNILQKKYNIYSFQSEKIEGREEVSVYPLQYRLVCPINNHKIEVEIEPDADSYNYDETSLCQLASKITIKDNGKLVTDKLRTYDCDRDVMLTNITVRPQIEIPNYSNGGALYIKGNIGEETLINEYFYYDRVKFNVLDNMEFYQRYKVLPLEK